MIYKRGKSYWFEFCWKGERVRRPTKVGNPNVARRIESAYRTKLANDEVDIRDRGAVPTLAAFKERFLDEIRVECKEHPETISRWKRTLPSPHRSAL